MCSNSESKEKTQLSGQKKPAAQKRWLSISIGAVLIFGGLQYSAPAQNSPQGSVGSSGNLNERAPGVAQGSPGSAGLPDTDALYRRQLTESAAKGLRSTAYINSLVNLGMHYNRKDEFEHAVLTLSKALRIIDSGALMPYPGSTEPGPPTITEHANGTVSATINKAETPYEDTVGELLPALVKAETECKQWRAAETHVKRLIKMADTNRIVRVPNLMFAYNQYAELLTKQHRNNEADVYRKKAEAINKTIRPL